MKVNVIVTEPGSTQYINLIENGFHDLSPTSMDAAIAYVTHSGVAELCSLLKKHESWNQTRKRWLIGIDFCRSDPFALTHLDTLPRSRVRVFDGQFVVNQKGCVPRVSYHPKLYLFRKKNQSLLVIGSGNLSYTGLQMGIEAGISISSKAENTNVLPWFNVQWNQAIPLAEIVSSYEIKYAASSHRRTPYPTEEDHVERSSRQTQEISSRVLGQLRVCEHLWVEAGRLHKNRGLNNPGNQLMLKKNTRVFFGFPAQVLAPDSLVGHIEVQYGNHISSNRSIRYSNNHMDVLSLPIPSAEGPAKYDSEVVRFTRIGLRRFLLELGSSAQASNWRRRSRSIDVLFKMRSGREWGIY